MRLSAVLLAVLSMVSVLAVSARQAAVQPAILPAGAAAGRPAVTGKCATLAGVSSYDLLVEGVLLGQGTVEVKQTGDDFLVEAAATIRSAIGSIYAIGYGGQAVMSPPPVRPAEAVIEERKGLKSRTYSLKFAGPDRASVVQTEVGPGKTTRRHQEFTSENLVLDPFSMVFFLRSHDWRVGEVQTFDLVTGRKQYEVQLTCRGETSLTVDGRPLPVWEIVLQTRSYENPRRIKLSGVAIYLARDPCRQILRITGKYKIGRFVVDRQRGSGRPVE